MTCAIIKGKNGKRYEADFKDEPVRVEMRSNDHTVEIFVELASDNYLFGKRPFAQLTIPRHLFSEALAENAKRVRIKAAE